MNEFRERGAATGLPAELRALPWGPPETFLGIPDAEVAFADASVVILPVPYEATVSYMGGTRFGPRGLLHASRFLELYDHELDAEPHRLGIYTMPELMLSGVGPETALAELRRAIGLLVDTGKFVLMIGGEHSVSGPVILEHADRAAPERLSVLQLDAHADLRTEYEGTPYSHACVMHSVYQRVRLVPVGIRSLTSGEHALMKKHQIPTIFGHELETDGWIDRTLAALGERVYVTVDVDYFDPSVMPSTGTPEPGGGSWYPTLRLLERVFREKTVVGCDVVELAPLPNVVAPDVLAAKLAYKLIAFHGLAIRN